MTRDWKERGQTSLAHLEAQAFFCTEYYGRASEDFLSITAEGASKKKLLWARFAKTAEKELARREALG